MGYKYGSGVCPAGHTVADSGIVSSGECKSCVKIRNASIYATPEGKAATKAWAATPSGKVFRRDAGYRKYGILNADGTLFTTSNAIDSYLLQSGDCGFCKKPLLEDIVVDHDHITFKFRSLLHRICNSIQVGNHTVESALRLVQYLRDN